MRPLGEDPGEVFTGEWPHSLEFPTGRLIENWVPVGGFVEWASSDGLMPADDGLKDFQTRSGCNRKERLSRSEQGVAEQASLGHLESTLRESLLACASDTLVLTQISPCTMKWCERKRL